ncbi:hypothetical protein GRF29_103g1315248 [Pseudopithomyces chartarum]|uniref:Uncharacterized protein n=1 Tax=Pseudopithomyces chartarum TaxID=1892770 RepID=A0AAN6LWJ1_9PLEO|nr:hypothetical protein GRF29_103g1315248 [Pseudopithomyces chartarum]
MIIAVLIRESVPNDLIRTALPNEIHFHCPRRCSSIHLLITAIRKGSRIAIPPSRFLANIQPTILHAAARNPPCNLSILVLLAEPSKVERNEDEQDRRVPQTKRPPHPNVFIEDGDVPRPRRCDAAREPYR